MPDVAGAFKVLIEAQPEGALQAFDLLLQKITATKESTVQWGGVIESTKRIYDAFKSTIEATIDTFIEFFNTTKSLSNTVMKLGELGGAYQEQYTYLKSLGMEYNKNTEAILKAIDKVTEGTIAWQDQFAIAHKAITSSLKESDLVDILRYIAVVSESTGRSFKDLADTVFTAFATGRFTSLKALGIDITSLAKRIGQTHIVADDASESMDKLASSSMKLAEQSRLTSAIMDYMRKKADNMQISVFNTGDAYKTLTNTIALFFVKMGQIINNIPIWQSLWETLILGARKLVDFFTVDRQARIVDFFNVILTSVAYIAGQIFGFATNITNIFSLVDKVSHTAAQNIMSTIVSFAGGITEKVLGVAAFVSTAIKNLVVELLLLPKSLISAIDQIPIVFARVQSSLYEFAAKSITLFGDILDKIRNLGLVFLELGAYAAIAISKIMQLVSAIASYIPGVRSGADAINALANKINDLAGSALNYIRVSPGISTYTSKIAADFLNSAQAAISLAQPLGLLPKYLQSIQNAGNVLNGVDLFFNTLKNNVSAGTAQLLSFIQSIPSYYSAVVQAISGRPIIINTKRIEDVFIRPNIPIKSYNNIVDTTSRAVNIGANLGFNTVDVMQFGQGIMYVVKDHIKQGGQQGLATIKSTQFGNNIQYTIQKSILSGMLLGIRDPSIYNALQINMASSIKNSLFNLTDITVFFTSAITGRLKASLQETFASVINIITEMINILNTVISKLNKSSEEEKNITLTITNSEEFIRNIIGGILREAGFYIKGLDVRVPKL